MKLRRRMATGKGAVLLRRRVGSAMAPSDFAAEFQHSLDIYQAIEAVVARAANGSGLIDATEVVRHLTAEHPGITMTRGRAGRGGRPGGGACRRAACPIACRCDSALSGRRIELAGQAVFVDEDLHLIGDLWAAFRFDPLNLLREARQSPWTAAFPGVSRRRRGAGSQAPSSRR